MKKSFFLLPFILILSSVACGGFQWNHAGTIWDENHNKTTLDMQNIHSRLEHKNYVFFIGYQIDSEGINYPTLSWMEKTAAKPLYKSFSDDLQDLFLYQNNVHFLDEKGLVYQWDGKGWLKSEIHLAPRSNIIPSHSDIISCRKSSLLKASPRRGSCSSYEQGWQVELSWSKIQGKICENRLIVIEQTNRRLKAKKISLENGTSLSEKTLTSIPDKICSIIF